MANSLPTETIGFQEGHKIGWEEPRGSVLPHHRTYWGVYGGFF